MNSHRRKQLAWISDHPPTLEQKKYLEDRDYYIVQLHSPWPNRWKNAQAVYNAMMRKCSPSVIVMVLPSSTMGGEFISLCRNIPVYQAVMRRGTDFWEWTGTWERLEGTKYKKHTEEIPLAFGEAEYDRI